MSSFTSNLLLIFFYFCQFVTLFFFRSSSGPFFFYNSFSSSSASTSSSFSSLLLLVIFYSSSASFYSSAIKLSNAPDSLSSMNLVIHCFLFHVQVVHAQSVVLEWKLYPSGGASAVGSNHHDIPGPLPRWTSATVHIDNPQISYTAKVNISPNDITAGSREAITGVCIYRLF